MSSGRLRVLLFAEAVTLAHVARIIALARQLDASRYEAIVACDPRATRFLDGEPFRHVALSSIPSAEFTSALARGAPVYSEATLETYVREDLQLIESLQPDLVVGDFRLSLSASARLAGVPFLAIANAYWCPGWQGGYPLPVLPATRWLPLSLVGAGFRFALPFVLPRHCLPLNRVRARHGLTSLGRDLRSVYSDADHVLVADLAALFPLQPLRSHVSYIGPLLWSPRVELPVWWDSLPEGRPIIYVTLGSSGHAALLPRILKALSSMPVTVIVSTAGQALDGPLPDGVHAADYLPGAEATARARLLVCNGGSLTTQQALSAGVPILGVAANMDQFMNMAPVVEEGAGLLLRADRLTEQAIRMAAQRLLDDPAAAAASRRLSGLLAAGPAAGQVFDQAVGRLLSGTSSARLPNSDQK
jgi:UDP:flavonoid glycosyltransferase YjiC (YdhE family)